MERKIVRSKNIARSKKHTKRKMPVITPTNFYFESCLATDFVVSGRNSVLQKVEKARQKLFS